MVPRIDNVLHLGAKTECQKLDTDAMLVLRTKAILSEKAGVDGMLSLLEISLPIRK